MLATWQCASISPGTTVAPSSRTTLAPGDAAARTSVAEPTAAIRPSRTSMQPAGPVGSAAAAMARMTASSTIWSIGRPPSAVEVPVNETRRCAGQPAVGDRVPQRLTGDLPQLDEDGGIPVEMRNREEGSRIRGEHRLLLAEVLDADGQDRPIRRGLVAEPPEIRLAERPFPRECLAGGVPRPGAVTFALGDLGQRQGQFGHVVDGRHTRTVLEGPGAGRYRLITTFSALCFPASAKVS